jgi:hypothetical protein
MSFTSPVELSANFPEPLRFIEQGSQSDPKVRKQRARILARALRKLGYDVAITPINPATTEMGMQM